MELATKLRHDPEPQKLKRIEILVVEDEPSIKVVMCHVFQTIDTHISSLWVGSYAEAVHALKGKPYDLVIADYLLDGAGNGLTLWHYCKSHYPHIPFLMMSSISTDVFLNLTRQFSSRPPPFLPKPFRTEECRNFVKSHLFNLPVW